MSIAFILDPLLCLHHSLILGFLNGHLGLDLSNDIFEVCRNFYL